MSVIKTLEVVAGTTLRVTADLSGSLASAIVSNLISGSETLVSSAVGQSSLNGFYYALHDVPNTRAWYVNKWFAVISANTYAQAQFVRAVKPEVD
jgi:hypothetical protein